MSANRVAVYLTVFANITAALLTAVTDLGATDLIVPLTGINAAALMFLRGWHQFEQAMYDAEQVQFAHRARTEQVNQATAPRSAASKLSVPKR